MPRFSIAAERLFCQSLRKNLPRLQSRSKRAGGGFRALMVVFSHAIRAYPPLAPPSKSFPGESLLRFLQTYRRT